MYLESLKLEAVRRGLLQPEEKIDLEKAFLLVRDMPYTRASSRDPQTILREWRGTCSGKHYLLKELFAELGYASRLIACTTVAQIEPRQVPGKLRRLLEESGGRFVDVHNYLVLELPGAKMIVDATWPLATKGMGTVVNENFIPGQDQQIACVPVNSWVVPADRDPQQFKDEILRESFTPEEIAHREEFIQTLGVMSNSRWVRLRLMLEKLLKDAFGRIPS